MKKEVKKLYRGYAELRDYEVQKAIDNNEKVQIIFEGDVMTLTPDELVSRKVKESQLIKSKIGSKDYVLYSYNWVPDSIDY